MPSPPQASQNQTETPELYPFPARGHLNNPIPLRTREIFAQLCLALLPLSQGERIEGEGPYSARIFRARFKILLLLRMRAQVMQKLPAREDATNKRPVTLPAREGVRG